MRDDLKVRTTKFAGNITSFRTRATDECSANFQLLSESEVTGGNFDLVEVTGNTTSDTYYLLLPKKTGEDDIGGGELRRRLKRDVSKQAACRKFESLKASMQKQCSDANSKSFSSSVPSGLSSQRQIETALAASENGDSIDHAPTRHQD